MPPPAPTSAASNAPTSQPIDHAGEAEPAPPPAPKKSTGAARAAKGDVETEAERDRVASEREVNEQPAAEVVKVDVDPRGAREFRRDGSADGDLGKKKKHRSTEGRFAPWFNSDAATATRMKLRGRFWTVLSVICIALALLLSDVFVLLQVESNTGLDVILSLVFGIFILEFVGLMLTDPTYCNSFFFWMDFFGTLSMIFDISYFLGTDATKVTYSDASELRGEQDGIVGRTAQAAKLAGRAGRLGRILKMLRYIPFLSSGHEDAQKERKTAKVISNQITNKVSTRVAFLAIGLCVVLPLLSSITRADVEESMNTWAQLLSKDGRGYFDRANTVVATSAYQTRIDEELKRFADFYADKDYGPFEVCFRNGPNNDFLCPHTGGPSVTTFDTTTAFSAPGRKSGIIVMREDYFRAKFDMAPTQMAEAVASIGMIILLVVTMTLFSIMTSKSLGVIVLVPLERMLTLVRASCAQIFKYSEEFAENGEEDEQSDDAEALLAGDNTEIKLLEKAVVKLSAVADIGLNRNKRPSISADMSEGQRLELAFVAPGLSQVFEEDDGRQSSKIVAAALVGGENEKSNVEALLIQDKDLSEHLRRLDTADFNAVEVVDAKKTVLASWILLHWGVSATWAQENVPKKSLERFLIVAHSRYQTQPFHNFSHALDVLYAVNRFSRLIRASGFLPDQVQFWLPLAGLAHDLGHPGVNNQYLVEIADKLALTYNDKSPLENMHCSTLFMILKEPETDVFALLERSRYKDIRKGLIEAILHTDMMLHFDMIKELAMLHTVNEETFQANATADTVPPEMVELFHHQNNQQLIINMLLHGADIGNPMKPWPIAKQLAFLCLDEFFAQGDMEKKAGIPVQMLNDREKVNPPNSQIGFIEFVIAPMAEKVVTLFPQLDGIAEDLSQNVQNWADMWANEASPDADALAKTRGRVQKVVSKLSAVKREFNAEVLN